MRLLLLLLGLYVAMLLTVSSSAEAACGGSGTTWSCTAGTTPAEINSAINSASDGATLTFAAGSYNWTSTQITYPLTKGITLICATQGACNVTLGGAAIGYPTGSSSKLYRLSGFTFSVSTQLPIWGCSGGGCGATLLSKVRIDHNTFNVTGSDITIIFMGENSATDYYAEGVIDHNTVNCTNSCYLLQVINNKNMPAKRKLGSASNLFVEDNTITISNMTNNGTGCVDGWGGHGVVVRFNTVSNCRMLMHGVGSGHAWGPINFEVYHNKIRMNNSDSFTGDGTRAIHHQGSGTMMYFENLIAQTPGRSHGDPIVVLHYRAWEAGSGTGLCNGSNVADGNRGSSSTYAGYPCFRQPGRDIDGVLFPAYSWRNRWEDDGSRIDMTCNGTSPSCSKHVLPNRDYYNATSINAQNSPTSPFNGTIGMGFGTIANRPTTCTTGPEALDAGRGGVGYWATDQGEWNSTNGATPDGQLYICSATNTWTLYYTPYKYPHPLQGGGGTTAGTTSPAAPTNLRVQ